MNVNVLVIGASGKTGCKIVRLLAESNQHLVRAMIRKTKLQKKMEELGAKPIIADLEQNFDYAVEDVNAIIFAAGSGSKTGPEKTIAVDLEGAKKAVDIAKEQKIERFIMLSSIGADQPENGPASIRHYLEAKKEADLYLQNSGLNYTIVRPGRLTDENGSGKIQVLNSHHKVDGTISRENVAKVLVESLTIKETYEHTFEILDGDEPIEEALKNLPAQHE